ncbi:MAG: pyridoxal phosphate-dependent aminotransferase [Gammaproteobacteria bacterium]|nr:pyridoxal phosphate-dependent aminotransferase [Gammaproteobacteria bacterium]MCY4339580.1 pyridoxal phosphate-dependent aminotransferase [Gammaproteobacteria bacterium]
MDAVQSPVIPVVADLIGETPGTISLGQGVVCYGPPEAALRNVMAHRGDLGQFYSPVEGIPELAGVLVRKLADENRINIGTERRVVVTAGANMGFLNALFAITDPGAEVILPTPYYFNHEMAVRMLNCVPVCVPTDHRFQVDAGAIAAAMTERTAAVVTISPNNPSGAVYPEQSLRAVNALCRERGAYHISDEAYEYFVYGDQQHFSPAAIDTSLEHTISLFSLSKAYGFSSWRIGYMIIPAHLFENIRKVQDTNLICPPLASQYAAIGALQAGRGYCDANIRQIVRNREFVLNELAKLRRITGEVHSDGALYAFPRLDTTLSDMQLVERLIREFRIATIPGSAFGMEDSCYLRVSYGALDESTLEEGMHRLVGGLNAIFTE